MSERHDEILDFIRCYHRSEGVPPSTRVIQRHFGYASQTSVMRHLRNLAIKGALQQLPDRSWSVQSREVQSHLFTLPIFGSIPAGVASPQEQEPDRRLACDVRAIFPKVAHPERLWGLEVRGDSMINAHIIDGDIAIMETREGVPGEIVAALVDDTASTLKRLVRLDSRLVLRAENPRYQDIRPERSLVVQGVFIGLLRKQMR